jgi:hypothetical protein
MNYAKTKHKIRKIYNDVTEVNNDLDKTKIEDLKKINKENLIREFSFLSSGWTEFDLIGGGGGGEGG